MDEHKLPQLKLGKADGIDFTCSGVSASFVVQSGE
jgi:hypothetical protein